MPPLRLACGRTVSWLVARAVASWREPAPQPRRAPAGMGVAIVPSKSLRRMRSAFLALQVLYLCELALRGHWVIAAALASAVLAAGLVLRRRAAPPAQRLVLTAQGRLHLLCAGGTVEQFRIDPASLRCGAWLVLRIVGAEGGARCLVFGPDNLDPAALSALRRRLVLVDPMAEAIAPGLGHRLVAGAHPSPAIAVRQRGPAAPRVG